MTYKRNYQKKGEKSLNLGNNNHEISILSDIGGINNSFLSIKDEKST